MYISTTEISPWSDNFYAGVTIDPISVSSLYNIRYQWQSLASCENINYSTLNLSDPSVVQYDANSPTLKFQKGALQRGNQYCVQVAAQDTYSSLAHITFSVLQGPRSGFCGLQSLNTGKEYLYTFTFSCNL